MTTSIKPIQGLKALMSAHMQRHHILVAGYLVWMRHSESNFKIKFGYNQSTHWMITQAFSSCWSVIFGTY